MKEVVQGSEEGIKETVTVNITATYEGYRLRGEGGPVIGLLLSLLPTA